MANAASLDLSAIAHELKLPPLQVERTLQLLDEGNTVAFITRYRKDHTGGLNEEQVRNVQQVSARERQLAERKAAILKSIETQGKLTPELRRQIESSRSPKRLEDLYLPYKPKKQTLATAARQKGLAPLAREILEATTDNGDLSERAAALVAPEKELHTTEEVLAGARHLIAEYFSEQADVRAELRKLLYRTGQLITTKIAKEEEPETTPSPEANAAADNASLGEATAEKKPGLASFIRRKEAEQAAASEAALSAKQKKRRRLEHALRDYADFREAVSRVPPHRVLAINRGERAKVLRAKIEGDNDALVATAIKALVPVDHPYKAFLETCARDALNRLLLPGLEREIRRELTEHAEEHAVQVFARNLRKLLLQPPVRNRRVLAIDPGFKSGCKLAALDEFGNVLGHEVIHVVGSEERLQDSRHRLIKLASEQRLSVMAIGNGTGSRETERLVADVIARDLQEQGVEYVSVNEAGASVYSTSPLGREELPDYDALFRGAISIGRRLLDPLSELVKINPANIGVGMYQHDVKAKHLQASLDAVVESCVNFVGVDVNTASPALLSYVSGLNQLTARRLYEHRRDHGPFRTRDEIREVPGIGQATFVQAAGFLKIVDGENPLDATWIHPESYEVATRLLQKLHSDPSELARLAAAQGSATRASTVEPAELNQDRGADSRPELARRLAEIDLASVAAELGIGQFALRDILQALAKPGRDPREDLPAPIFRTEVLKLEDLQPGMELTGTVLNVVDFGAFVDIGMSDSALVHISRLADRYVRDPHEVVSIGDSLRVWVLSVDKERRRVSLTAVAPGSEPPAVPRPEVSPPPQRQAPPRAAGKQPRKATAARPPKQPQRARPAKAQRPPAKPITPGMVRGTEPMRSFGDLLQYYEVKHQSGDQATGDK